MNRIDPGSEGAPNGKATTDNVVPYDVFLRARARLDAGGRDVGASPPSRPNPDGSKGMGHRKKDARTARAMELIREEFRILPDVRPAKVREARRRIRMGYYERPEVLEEIVRRILADDLDPDNGLGRGGA